MAVLNWQAWNPVFLAFAAGLTANKHIQGPSGSADKQGQNVHVTSFPAGELH